jgi:hypothetical protein
MIEETTWLQQKVLSPANALCPPAAFNRGKEAIAALSPSTI